MILKKRVLKSDALNPSAILPLFDLDDNWLVFESLQEGRVRSGKRMRSGFVRFVGGKLLWAPIVVIHHSLGL